MGMIKSFKDLGLVDGKYRTHYVMEDGKEIITEVAKDLVEVFDRTGLERGTLEMEGLANRDEFDMSMEEIADKR